jgi:hypothetical protein
MPKNHRTYSLSIGFLILGTPVFEHKRGSIPISMFGKRLVINGTEIRHCLHGSEKV